MKKKLRNFNYVFYFSENFQWMDSMNTFPMRVFTYANLYLHRTTSPWCIECTVPEAQVTGTPINRATGQQIGKRSCISGLTGRYTLIFLEHPPLRGWDGRQKDYGTIFRINLCPAFTFVIKSGVKPNWGRAPGLCSLTPPRATVSLVFGTCVGV